MSEQLNKEVLDELKQINRKLDMIYERRGLSTPLKIVALVFGAAVVGPLLMAAVGLVTRMFN